MDIQSAITQNFLTLDDETTVTQLIGKLKQANTKACLVFRKDKYLGTVEKKDLLRAKPDSQHARIDKFLQRTPFLSAQASLLEAAYLMSQGNFEFLPVVENKQISGVLTASDLLSLSRELPEVKGKRVKDLKVLHVSSVNKADPLAKATRIMHEEHVDHIPVFDKGKLSGILSCTDLMQKYLNWSPERTSSTKFTKMASTRAARTDWSPFSSMTVGNFSTNYNLFVVQESQLLTEAVKQMTQNNVSDLLVMKGEKYAGLITIHNLLSFIASQQKHSYYSLQFKGVQEADLTEHQSMLLQEIAEHEAEKLQRKIKQPFKITVHIKEIHKKGKQHLFDLALHVEFPGKFLTSEKSDWELEKALHKCFDSVSEELDKK